MHKHNKTMVQRSTVSLKAVLEFAAIVSECVLQASSQVTTRGLSLGVVLKAV